MMLKLQSVLMQDIATAAIEMGTKMKAKDIEEAVADVDVEAVGVTVVVVEILLPAHEPSGSSR